MTTNLSTYQRKKRQKELDERYMKKQIEILKIDKKNIANRMYKYRYNRKDKDKRDKLFMTEVDVRKIFRINKRTLKTLTDYGYIRDYFLLYYFVYEYTDLLKFIRRI